jgi:predicted dehydrogenase
MKNGKHGATEVPAATTTEDCWALVEAAEKHRKHCLMMENCNYDRMEMMAFNMVRQGLFGELLHAEGGYLHDLRGIKFENRNEGLWRRAWSRRLNGNLYPTHGLGPISNCLDINRGDRFDYLVSMSGPSRGLQDWAREHFPTDAPERREQFVLGDVNTSLIKTARRRTIVVQHCTNLPRPYSRIHMVQGTRGMFQGYPNRLYIAGRGEPHRWIDAASVHAEFDHPLWRAIEAQSAGAGHGGMDYIEDYRLIQCLREGRPTDMNVYDAAALSAVVDLSVRSTARRSRAVDFPDFTRGRWRANPKLQIDARLMATTSGN